MTGTRAGTSIRIGIDVVNHGLCFMTPNHAYTLIRLLLSRLQTVIKKRLALSKQVLVLSARHFYAFLLKDPISPSARPAFAPVLFKRLHHLSWPVEFHAQLVPRLPLYQPRGLSTQRMEHSMAGPATAQRRCAFFLGMESVPEHRHSVRLLDELLGFLCRTYGASGPRHRIQHYPLAC